MKIRIETPLDSEEDEIVIRCRKLDSRIMTVIEAYNRNTSLINNELQKRFGKDSDEK